MKRILMAALIALGGPALAQFNAAAEVKPILQMIKPQWVSLREYDGQDLLYFTILEVYRCGLDGIFYAVNGGPPVAWVTPPCPGDQTFADIPEGRLPYVGFPLGSVESVRIELVYDDGTVEAGEYERETVMTP
mmetsp:Transcript_29475/g.57764  ORF Transcript_29475/g.57764 Transcript_29475/m.57764 type:complete len:133 (-) Transcript_29475:3185-3583(-)